MSTMMNRSEQIDKALKDILKDVDCAKANKQCDIDYFLSSIEKCAKAALALPRRQCDVGTAEEQAKRYHATGEVYHTLTLTNALEWGQMPYESEANNAKQ